jgi:predicted phosphodiesterase
MRIQYVSDLHLEFRSKLPKLKPCGDVLVVAGDIGDPGSGIYRLFIRTVCAQFAKVFIIAGNHEHYFSDDVDSDIRKAFGDYENLTYLSNSFEDYQGVRFVGSTLWSHIIDLDPCALTNDFKCITGLNVRKYNAQHEACRAYIKQITQTSDVPCVVITHHMPSWTLLADEFMGEPLNQCYASNCEDLFSNVLVWIYGHTHRRGSKVVNGVPCVCNPVGYPGEAVSYQQCADVNI